MGLSDSCKTAKRYALGVKIDKLNPKSKKINNIKKLFQLTTKEKY